MPAACHSCQQHGVRQSHHFKDATGCICVRGCVLSAFVQFVDSGHDSSLPDSIRDCFHSYSGKVCV